MTYILHYRTVYMPINKSRRKEFADRAALDRFVRLNRVAVIRIEELSHEDR